MKLRVEFQDAVSKNTLDWNWDALKCFNFNSIIYYCWKKSMLTRQKVQYLEVSFIIFFFKK